MSYDLYFYKRKGANLSEREISDYLNNNVNSTSDSDRQWFVQNDDTQTYYSFDHNEAETDPESIELWENFTDFDNTHFTFNLNYLRPDFFGVEAFRFVDKFIKDLDLFVLNPQSTADADNPLKPTAGELYKNWSETNARNSANFAKEYELNYFPIEKSNDFYFYNSNRNQIQEEIGPEYFVPRLFLFLTKAEKKVVTFSVWPENIPIVFPPADYFLITKKKKKLFKTVEESGLISSQKLFALYENQIDSFDFKNCKIIRPDKAQKTKDLFNSIPFDFQVKDFAEGLPIEKVVNVKPTE